MVCPLCSVNKREIELTNCYFNASDPVLHLHVSLHSFQQERFLSYAEEVGKLILSNVLLLLSRSFHPDIGYLFMLLFSKICTCSFAAGCFTMIVKNSLLE